MKPIKTVAILGLGLLGGSIGRAVKKYSPTITVNGYDLYEASGQRALEIGFIDEAFIRPEDAVKDADCVILSAPLSAFAPLAQMVIPYMKDGAILTDTGSVKGSVVEAIKPLLTDNIIFIPAHPIAGTEQSGVEAGFADLFQNKRVIFTPLDENNQEALKSLSDFWQALGANTETMEIAHHDLVFAVVSHIPHLVAYNIVGTAAHLEQVSEGEVIRYSASGFRDFTRLASSDPIVWRDVFLNNKEAVLEMLGRFVEDLFDLQRAIRYEDGAKLQEYFTKAQKIRKSIIDAGQESADVNFGRKN